MMGLSFVVVVQVAVGLLIVFGVYRMSLWIMQQDRLVVTDNQQTQMKKAFKILDGYAEAGMASNRVWNTVNPSANNFRALPRSYNRKGGAQFSYSFWLLLDDTTPENVAYKDIFVRGDTREYTYSKSTQPPADVAVTRSAPNLVKSAPVVTAKTDMAIKCPRVRFGPTYDTLVVDFNTLHDVDQSVQINSYASGAHDSTLRKNVMKLIDHKWVLFTFVFEDNVAINEFEDGIIMRFYINDLLYHTARVKSTLRQNNGNFYLLPSKNGSSIKHARIGDVTYYNYAASSISIGDVYRQGPPKHAAKYLSSNTGSPLWLSIYNEMDIYNT